MNNNLLLDLRKVVYDVAERFSNPERDKNGNKETFTPVEIKVLSETTAAVYYDKLPTRKLALFFFYYLNSNNPHWAYFVPTDAHLLGISKLNRLYDIIEEHNKKVVLSGI